MLLRTKVQQWQLQRLSLFRDADTETNQGRNTFFAVINLAENGKVSEYQGIHGLSGDQYQTAHTRLTLQWLDMFICSSELWFMFILWLSVIYFALTLISTILNKETHRYKAVSILHDNLMMVILLSATVHRLACNTTHLPLSVSFPNSLALPSTSTCWLVVYSRFYFGINVPLALGVVLAVLQRFGF